MPSVPYAKSSMAAGSSNKMEYSAKKACKNKISHNMGVEISKFSTKKRFTLNFIFGGFEDH